MLDSSTNLSLPAPTSARVELPDSDAVRALGLSMSLDEARLVLTCLSCFIARGRSKTRDKVQQMLSGLIAACRVEGVRDGEVIPAAHPELRLFGWPSGATALRRLDIDHLVLELYWARARTRATDACLPKEWAVQFAPPRVWPAVLTLIGWGPAETGLRLEDAVTELAQQPISIRTRRRPGGAKLSKGTIATRVNGVHQLLDVLVDLRGRVEASRNPGLPIELLAARTRKPERPDLDLCGAREAQVDTAGPTFSEARGMLRRLRAEFEAAPARSRYFRLRRLCIAGLLLAHGQRVDCLRLLNVADYLPEHRFGDVTCGPAIVYRPGKTRGVDEPYMLALPRELADWLESWIAYTHRSVGEPDSPLWPSTKPKLGQAMSRISGSGFERLISGHAAKDGTGSTPLLSRGENRFQGYNPHSFRHTCYQAARRAGAQAKLEQPHAYGHVVPDDFARAVVGHDLIRSVGDFYRDLDQQHLARVAIEYVWSELWHQPARQGLDPQAIKRAKDELELVSAAKKECARQFEAVQAELGTLHAKSTTLSGDLLHHVAIAGQKLQVDAVRFGYQLTELSERERTAQATLDQALSIQVSIPDELTDDDHARLLSEALGDAEETAAELNGPLAEEVTVADLAEIYRVSEQTVNRWVRKGPPGGCQVWNPDGWKIEGPRKKTLLVAAINRAMLTQLQVERLDFVRRRRAAQQAVRAPLKRSPESAAERAQGIAAAAG